MIVQHSAWYSGRNIAGRIDCIYWRGLLQLPSDMNRAMREASGCRTVTDTDSYAFFRETINANEGMTAAILFIMDINLRDENLLGFIQEIIENKSLLDIFSGSKYWKKGGEQAVKLISNSSFHSISPEITQIIENLLQDVCPEQCEAGCNISWNQMSATLLNGDGLCEYHHNHKEKLENE